MSLIINGFVPGSPCVGCLLLQGAAGNSYLDNRLHVVGSAEYLNEKSVGPGDYGIGLAGGRDWFTQRSLVNRNVPNDGSPQYMIVSSRPALRS